LFDGEKEDRVLIDTLDHIYDFTDRLRATAMKYLDRSNASSPARALAEGEGEALAVGRQGTR
jgi:hypothetical protein